MTYDCAYWQPTALQNHQQPAHNLATDSLGQGQQPWCRLAASLGSSPGAGRYKQHTGLCSRCGLLACKGEKAKDTAHREETRSGLTPRCLLGAAVEGNGCKCFLILSAGTTASLGITERSDFHCSDLLWDPSSVSLRLCTKGSAKESRTMWRLTALILAVGFFCTCPARAAACMNSRNLCRSSFVY